MTRPYYTLLIRDGAKAPWRIEFGAYGRDDVEFERQDVMDRFGSVLAVHPANTKIIRTSDKQADIEYVVNGLNVGSN